MMTSKQFALVAALIRSREPVRSAAELVIVEGMRNVDAARAVGLGPQSVSNTVARFLSAHAQIVAAYGRP